MAGGSHRWPASLQRGQLPATTAATLGTVQLGVAAPPLGRKRKLRVTAAALESMGASYNTHFRNYTRDRPKEVVQKIPGSVWKLVYQDFLVEKRSTCEASGALFRVADLPSERALQDGLRDMLSEVATGNSDPSATGGGDGGILGALVAAVQGGDLMCKLKASDTYKKRKLFDSHESLIADDDELEVARDLESVPNDPNNDASILGQHNSGGEAANGSAANVRGSTVRNVRSTATNAVQSPKPCEEWRPDAAILAIEKSIGSMVTAMAVSGAQQEGMVAAVRAQGEALKAQLQLSSMDLESRRECRAAEIAAHESQERDRVMNRLVLLHEHGVLSKDEYRKRLAEASGLMD